MSATTDRSVRTYEFDHNGGRTRAVAETKDEALEMVAEVTQIDPDGFDLVQDYAPESVPDDDVFIAGHPFEDGDRIAYKPQADGRLGVAMTVNISGNSVSFTEETSPYGVRTFAERNVTEERADATLARLYRSGWRQVPQ